MVNTKRAYAEEHLPGLLLPLPLFLQWAPANSHLHRRPSDTSRWIWFSLLWGHCSFPLGPDVCKILFVPSKSRVSVSPVESPMEALQSNLAGLKSQIPRGFLFPLPDSQAGKCDLGFRTFTTVGELLWFCCSPVCGLPTWWAWDLILLWLCTSYHLTAASLLSLDMRYLFLVCSSILLSMFVNN